VSTLVDLLWIIAPAAEVAWVVAMAVYLVLQRRSAHATLAWIMAMVFLPLVGLFVYLLLGPRRYDKHKARRGIALERVNRATVVDPAAPHDRSPAADYLIRLCEGAVGLESLARSADVTTYFDGDSAFAAIERDIGGARHHVHLEYYIWSPDRLGTRLRDLLCRRAREGVEVRVLVDGVGSFSAGSRFWRPLREAGGQVVVFNPISPLNLRRRMANFRTHRKIAVIDGTVGFTGGMNVSEHHVAELSGDAAWRDSHLRLRGPAVKGLQMVFLADWHYAHGETPQGPPYIPEPGGCPPGAQLVQVVPSGPDENRDAIQKLFFSSIAGASDRVLLTTPYFVPDETMVRSLETAALRGADVRVLVPRGGDIRLVAAAARSYYPELLEQGVRIFEYGPAVLHAKTLVVDDDLAVVGTANVDNRSFRLNFEVVVAVYQRSVCNELARVFDRDLARAEEITLEMTAAEPFSRRLSAATARLLSPLL